MITAFLVPLLGHFVLVAFLYGLLTIRRYRAVRTGAAQYDDFARPGGDSVESARVRRNIANQFEAPVFLYFAAMFLLWSEAVTSFDVAMAWVFLLGRIAHSAVHVSGDNVRLRGSIYSITFLAICGLMGHVALVVLQGSGR